MTGNQLPKLRRLQVKTGEWQGRPVLMLMDPMGLSNCTVAVPRDIAPILELCDGTRDAATLRTAFQLRTGLALGLNYINSMLDQLDEALLLENERFYHAYNEAVERFRTDICRPPVLAGRVYPADPVLLARTIKEYFDDSISEIPAIHATQQIRGLISPHIDYQRGSGIYAGVWQRATEAARVADIVIILGTNHQDCQRLLIMTRQHYSTPWGTLSTASGIVNQVAAAMGEEVFIEEIHHRTEHSIETAVIWLHYLAKENNCQLVPVLCGSFDRFIAGDKQPGQDEEIALFVNTLKAAVANQHTLIVAAADLAHVGLAFGDRYPVDVVERAWQSQADEELLNVIASGDAEAMFSQVKRDGDRRRICGLSPIYLMLRLLGGTTGEITGYAQCPADSSGTSLVTICGMLFS